ncbi:MAG TPA: sialidase family protein [Nitrososphaera sp.]|nr:sialidase family protein [Nitrososphaera sp.]
MKKVPSSVILQVVSLALFLFVPFITYYDASLFSLNDAEGSTAIESDNKESSDQDVSDRIGFGNVTNLTDNPNDSAYGQVAASDNNVYVVWQDSTTSDLSNNNYDIYIKKSADRGETFAENNNSGNETTEVQNLSNNPGFSEHPQIAAYKEKVHVAWTDNTLGNKEIFFARSIDNGTAFSETINLSNTTNTSSRNLEITAFENNVYVVWLDEDEQGNGAILFKASNDGGNTFSNVITIAGDLDNNDITLPKVAAYGENVHITWNAADNTQEEVGMTDLLYVKSSDQGNTFSPPIKLNNNEEKVGEAQLAAYKNAVYVVWGSSPYDQVISNLFFTKSVDNGNTFSNATEVKSENFVNPSNVEIMVVASNEGNGEQSLPPSFPSSQQFSQQQQQPHLYITGQVPLSDENEEIFVAFSSDNGDTFSDISTNLSSNLDISECPSIATAGDSVYVVWQDRTPGNNEVLFTKGKA